MKPTPASTESPRTSVQLEVLVELGSGEAGDRPRAPEDADRLADDETDDDTDRGGVAQGRAEAAADDGDAGGEEREDGHREARGEGPDLVLDAARPASAGRGRPRPRG